MEYIKYILLQFRFGRTTGICISFNRFHNPTLGFFAKIQITVSTCFDGITDLTGVTWNLYHSNKYECTYTVQFMVVMWLSVAGTVSMSPVHQTCQNNILLFSYKIQSRNGKCVCGWRFQTLDNVYPTHISFEYRPRIRKNFFSLFSGLDVIKRVEFWINLLPTGPCATALLLVWILNSIDTHV